MTAATKPITVVAKPITADMSAVMTQRVVLAVGVGRAARGLPIAHHPVPGAAQATAPGISGAALGNLRGGLAAPRRRGLRLVRRCDR